MTSKKYTKWKVYIISVEESDRRENVERLKQVLEYKNIKTEIINAYYYKTTNVVNKLLSSGISYYSPDLNLSQSQIGCFLSHREAWKKIESDPESETTLSIILEDDMDLIDSNNFNLDYLLDDINIESEKSASIDGLIMWKHPVQLSENNPKNVTKNLQEFYYQWGLCAYCITKETATKLLTIKQFYEPVDQIVFKDIFPKLNIYHTVKEHFINLGQLTGNYKNGIQFKSLIWT